VPLAGRFPLLRKPVASQLVFLVSGLFKRVWKRKETKIQKWRSHLFSLGCFPYSGPTSECELIQFLVVVKDFTEILNLIVFSFFFFAPPKKKLKRSPFQMNFEASFKPQLKLRGQT
jgi:hypothetical protein